jgi:hypothetical protein
MRMLALILVGVSALCGCDSGVEWHDQQYEVSWMDTSENRSLYRSLEGGDAIGRVTPEVVAVGSNEKYVVAKQKSLSNGTFSYYIIDRKKDQPLLNGNEIAEGPFSASEFDALKQERQLPEFSATFGN